MPSATDPTGGGPGARRARPPPSSLGLAACLALAACAACSAPPADHAAPSRTVVEGLDYSEFAGTTLARRIRAEQLVVVPKRFGIFQMSALSEAVLTRARIEVFEPASAGAPPRAGVDAVVPVEGFALPGLADVRRLAGATFYDLQIVLVRAGAPVARVGAAQASADVRSGNLILKDFRLEHPATGRVVRSTRAVWHRRSGEFSIGGDYAVEERGAVRTGRGLVVGADFALRTP